MSEGFLFELYFQCSVETIDESNLMYVQKLCKLVCMFIYIYIFVYIYKYTFFKYFIYIKCIYIFKMYISFFIYLFKKKKNIYSRLEP